MCCRMPLARGESTLYVLDALSGLCLCDLPGLPRCCDALPRAVLREVAGTMSAALEYAGPARPVREELVLGEVVEGLPGHVLELERELLEALQKEDQERVYEILAPRKAGKR